MLLMIQLRRSCVGFSWWQDCLWKHTRCKAWCRLPQEIAWGAYPLLLISRSCNFFGAYWVNIYSWKFRSSCMYKRWILASCSFLTIFSTKQTNLFGSFNLITNLFGSFNLVDLSEISNQDLLIISFIEIHTYFWIFWILVWSV